MTLDDCCCVGEAVCFFCEVHSLSDKAVDGETCAQHWPQHIREKIQQRRRQIIVHSTLYYALDETVIPDARYDQFARHLITLQAQFPEQSEQVEYMREEFRDFLQPTGFDLPHDDPAALSTARWLLKNRQKDTP